MPFEISVRLEINLPTCIVISLIPRINLSKPRQVTLLHKIAESGHFILTC